MADDLISRARRRAETACCHTAAALLRELADEVERLTADHERSRDAAANQVSRWMEAAEIEHGHRLAAEAERDAVLALTIRRKPDRPDAVPERYAVNLPGSLHPFGCWGPRGLGYETREQAIAAVRKAAGLED